MMEWLSVGTVYTPNESHVRHDGPGVVKHKVPSEQPHRCMAENLH